jgi:acetylornithine deacetylase/succinyl-diaminopimelate desuccinylase-like protein
MTICPNVIADAPPGKGTIRVSIHLMIGPLISITPVCSTICCRVSSASSKTGSPTSVVGRAQRYWISRRIKSRLTMKFTCGNGILTEMLTEVLKTLEGRRYQSLEKLKEFLAIPSISAKPDFAQEVRRCAFWLADQLKFAELETSVMETGSESHRGHPCVVAKNKHVPGRPTVLLYGHYDVQPPEPLAEWVTPPFEPTVRKDANGFDAVFARGAVDDKGQVYAHVEAITAWQAHGGVPVNLIVLIEGEEEIGSENLVSFLSYYKDHLKSDICLISDTAMVDRHTPAIEYGLRGLVYAEVKLTGPSHDLHSGIYGGAAPNPANALVTLLASLTDERGRVTIPGFYDEVLHIDAREKSLLAEAGFDEAAFLKGIDVPFPAGEAGYSVQEKISVRPTLDINGLTAGYQGAGAKTVIGATASAKLSMRLVPYQDPIKIKKALEETLRARAPKNYKLDIEFHGASPAFLTPVGTPAMDLAAVAIEKVWNKKPRFTRSGGTIPVGTWIKQTIGCDSLFVGFGLNDDRLHSPNEKFDLACFYNGQRTAAALYEALADLNK